MLREKATEVEQILAKFVMPEGLRYSGCEFVPQEPGGVVDAVDFYFMSAGNRRPRIRISGLDFIESGGVPGQLQDLVETKVRVLARSLRVDPTEH